MAKAYRCRTRSKTPPRNCRQAARGAKFRATCDCGSLSTHLCEIGNRKITECTFAQPLGMCPVSPPIQKNSVGNSKVAPSPPARLNLRLSIGNKSDRFNRTAHKWRKDAQAKCSADPLFRVAFCFNSPC